MSAISAPKCRLCPGTHWPREGCFGTVPKGTLIDLSGSRSGARNNRESGQRVASRPPTPAKGHTVRSAAPKTHKSGRQPEPADSSADRAIEAKPAVGTAKPRRAAKRKKKATKSRLTKSKERVA